MSLHNPAWDMFCPAFIDPLERCLQFLVRNFVPLLNKHIATKAEALHPKNISLHKTSQAIMIRVIMPSSIFLQMSCFINGNGNSKKWRRLQQSKCTESKQLVHFRVTQNRKRSFAPDHFAPVKDYRLRRGMAKNVDLQSIHLRRNGTIVYGLLCQDACEAQIAYVRVGRRTDQIVVPHFVHK